ncbi:hypothetical protein Peur_059942 [Populus x canadensis]
MHYSLKIEAFSLLLKTKVEKRLCLYPKGNKKGNLPRRWEVNAEFKLFVFDQINNKYLTVQVKRFHEMKTEWGFDQLLSLETFNDASKGYLVKDCCVFGAEIFVIKPTRKWELHSMIKDFSKLHKSSYVSKAFTAGGRSWRIKVYPKGNAEAKGDSLSKTVWAEYKLRVLDQRHDKHVEKTTSRWLTSSDHTRGFHKFMPLGDLREVSKGYVRNDNLIVEAEILTLSVSKLFS